MSESRSNLLLGVSGSVSALKAPELSARLRREGYDLKTILTKSAQQFTTTDSMLAMSRGEVYDSRQGMTGWRPTHIDLAEWADLALIAPAGAATIGRLACGIAEGLLAETFLALPPEVDRYIAPAMNGHMFNQPSVQRNLIQLEEDGYHVIPSRVGELACGYQGEGKLALIEYIVRSIRKDTVPGISSGIN
jgi:phosphopantothenoylcysteine synthetase/decarboxylase